MFFTLFGYWPHGGGGGSPKGWVHNLLMQFFTLGSSKMEVFETCFFDIVTTQNDHPRYVKHVLGRIYMYTAAGRHGHHGRDLVPSSSSLLAAVRTGAGGL